MQEMLFHALTPFSSNAANFRMTPRIKSANTGSPLCKRQIYSRYFVYVGPVAKVQLKY